MMRRDTDRTVSASFTSMTITSRRDHTVCALLRRSFTGSSHSNHRWLNQQRPGRIQISIPPAGWTAKDSR